MAEILGGEADEAEQQFEASAAAVAMALDGAKDNPHLTGPITAFLAEQRALVSEQRHHLGEQLKRLRLGILDQRMSIVLKVMTAVVGFAIAVGIGAAIWYAAHDNGLVIEPFSVPPDMAQRGLTGQVVAAQLLDKLAALQDSTDSARPAGSYTNNWGDDIKVQIPETGVSIGQFYGLLVTWLGRETHITGEVFRTANGLAIAARGGGDGGAMVRGSEADLDKLLQQTAETIYKRTQPYRYAIYAEQHGKLADVRAILERLTVEGGSPRERAWAHLGLGVLKRFNSDWYGDADEERAAIALVPDFALAHNNVEGAYATLGHDEAALKAGQNTLRLLQSDRDIDMSTRARTILLQEELAGLAYYVNDFITSLHYNLEAAQLPDYSGGVEGARENIVVIHALLHDRAAAQKAWGELSPSSDATVQSGRYMTRFAMTYWLGDWASVVAQQVDVEKSFVAVAHDPATPGYSSEIFRERLVWPYAAYAMAKLGDFKGAHALIDKTPTDCFVCVRTRGDIDTAERNWGGAQYWFANAVHQAPSIPLGYYDWGVMLLAKGDLDGAIAKFDIANQKGPHFADPLELWGEALIAKNRSDLALAKFAEADKYAPNWGRLHLKWGEALLWSGDKPGATKQFALAATLDLSTADKATLARMGAKHG